MAGITLTIEVDDKGTVKIKQLADESKEAFSEIEKGPKQAQPALDGLQQSWVALTAKIAAATAVTYTVTKTISSFVDEAAEAEEVETRLRYALETTGYSWQFAKTSVDQFANSVQASTRFSDEEARRALTDMMMYTRDFSKAQMGAKLAMDMSIRTGQDLGSASRLIGMAMSGNVEMLGRYIPELRNLDARLGENATMAQKAEYAMKILNEKFGGTAQSELDTYAAKLKQFKNSWSDFKEFIGNQILPPLKALLDQLRDIGKELAKEPPPYKEIPLFKVLGVEVTRRVPLKGEELEEVNRLRRSAETYRRQMLAEEVKKKPDVFLEDPKKLKEIEDFKKKQQEDTLESWKIYLEGEQSLRDVAATTGAENTIKGLDEIKKLSEKGQEDLLDSWKIYLESKQDALDEAARAQAENTLKQLDEEADIRIQMRRDDRQAWLETYAVPTDLQRAWEDMSKSLGSSFEAGFFDLFKGGIKDIGDAFRQFCDNIVQSFARAVSKMISNWIMFGGVTGEYKTGSGLLGLIGGMFGAGGTAAGGGGGTVWPTPGGGWGEWHRGGPVKRYHLGMLAGDEIPAILQSGEYVVSRKGVQALDQINRGMMPGGLTINVPISIGDSFRNGKRLSAELRDDIEAVVTRKIKEYS